MRYYFKFGQAVEEEMPFKDCSGFGFGGHFVAVVGIL